ncbi:MAG: MOSC domain-containing protein [Oscillatoria princeps RMCB-10]|nr:MOSC domain-containing protein [Oscillatoria princeps RMCB-10]
MSAAKVKQLFIHPIKGLTPEQCERVFLTAGHGIKGDRAFALMYGGALAGAPEPAVPWMSKKNFAVQNDWPGLAALDCSYDPNTDRLTVKHEGVELLAASTGTPSERQRIGAFFTGYLAAQQPTEAARHPERAPLHLAGTGSGETRYPDREPVHISLLSQASLDELAQAAGQPVDVRRFRPNILLEGVPAWEEFSWIGKQFQLGGASIEVSARIGRCVNIEVNPDTGLRDVPLLTLLQKQFGHAQTGVLATVSSSGAVATGDAVIPQLP